MMQVLLPISTAVIGFVLGAVIAYLIGFDDGQDNIIEKIRHRLGQSFPDAMKHIEER